MLQISRKTFIFDKRNTQFKETTLKIICCNMATLGLKGISRVKGISTVFQKLIKYFCGATILTSFMLPAAWVFAVIFTLDLNEAYYQENQQYWHCYLKLVHFYRITINFLMFLNNCHYIRLNYVLEIFCIIYLGIIYLTYAVPE